MRVRSLQVRLGVLAFLSLVSAIQSLQSAGKQIAVKSADLPLLPGRGLAQHPFLYCGEWQRRTTSDQVIYVVREGKVDWSYTNPGKGELGDCTMLSNGNILFSRQVGASEITPNKKIVWNYDGKMGDSLTCPIFILESASFLENRADQICPILCLSV